MGAWAEPWIFFNITAFRKKNPRFPEMNHPFCLLQKKRHQNWLWDGRAEQDPWLPFLIGVIQASPFANSVLLFGPTWQQQRWIMEVFHATQKDEIICLLMKTLLSHWRLWIMAAGGSASLIGALQVLRMHLQRDVWIVWNQRQQTQYTPRSPQREISGSFLLNDTKARGG